MSDQVIEYAPGELTPVHSRAGVIALVCAALALGGIVITAFLILSPIPGPMGSRGLGQLAYDKRMRILAASQVDEYAVETEQTELGLLTYALVHEGLERRQADYKPKDGVIQLSEWLGYAVLRVPRLYREWKDGSLEGGRKLGRGLLRFDGPVGTSDALQHPQLFDFGRPRDAMMGPLIP